MVFPLTRSKPLRSGSLGVALISVSTWGTFFRPFFYGKLVSLYSLLCNDNKLRRLITSPNNTSLSLVLFLTMSVVLRRYCFSILYTVTPVYCPSSILPELLWKSFVTCLYFLYNNLGPLLRWEQYINVFQTVLTEGVDDSFVFSIN